MSLCPPTAYGDEQVKLALAVFLVGDSWGHRGQRWDMGMLGTVGDIGSNRGCGGHWGHLEDVTEGHGAVGEAVHKEGLQEPLDVMEGVAGAGQAGGGKG